MKKAAWQGIGAALRNEDWLTASRKQDLRLNTARK